MTSPQLTAAAGTTPFEVGARSHCSRTHSSRGRPNQCARAAARTSSGRYGSRGRSAPRSRSSTRSRRPSADVELRSDISMVVVSTFEQPCVNACATGLVCDILDNAMDDIVTDLEFYIDDDCVLDADHVLNSCEPDIAEEAEEIDDFFLADKSIAEVCASDDEEVDDQDDNCDIDSDVCSSVCEDDLFMAASFAKIAVSDDLITDALSFEQEAAPVLQSIDWDAFSEAETEDEDVEAPFSDEAAFGYANNIFSGAFVEATTTWQKQEEDKAFALDALREKAKSSLLQAAKDNSFHIEALKQKARDGLLKAAEAKAKAQKEEELEAAKSQVKIALSKGLQTGSLSSSLAAALKKDKFTDLQSKLQKTFTEASASGKLAEVLGKATQEEALPEPEPEQDNDDEEAVKRKVREALLKGMKSGVLKAALQKNKWEDLRSQMQKSLTQSVANGKLADVIQDVMAISTPAAPAIEIKAVEIAPSPLPEAATPTAARSLSSSRSRRRIIGGVVRTPAMQLDMEVPSSSPSSMRKQSKSKAAKAAPTAFRMDMDEDDSKNGRSSSLTRGYDTLGVQFYSLADTDELAPASTSSASKRPISKTRAKIHAASSAMSADLGDNFSSTFSSRSPASPAFRQSFAPVSFKMDQKMRSSSSLGSLSSATMKYNPGGLLPALAPEKKSSSESIAWSLQVAKTSSKWGSTGLRGSASMIF